LSKVKIRLYSHLAQVLGTREIQLQASDLSELLQKISNKFGPGGRKRVQSALVLVNGKEANISDGCMITLKKGDEVDLLPPVAGG